MHGFCNIFRVFPSGEKFPKENFSKFPPHARDLPFPLK